MGKLMKCDFNNLEKPVGVDLRPVLLVSGKTFWRLSSWEELLKLFYYNACNTRKGKGYFDDMSGRRIRVCDGTLAESDTYGSDVLFAGDPGDGLFDYVKFSDTRYVIRYESGKRRGVTSTENLRVMGCVIKDLGLKGVELYLATGDGPADGTDGVVSGLNGAGKKEKSASRCVSRIDSDILSPEEKFFNRINREFDRKVLIGDIAITSQEEDGFLRTYMRSCLARLRKTGRLNLTKNREKAFAFGLVRFAMRYYQNKTLWPYLEEEYGVSVLTVQQGVVHDEFRRIMLKYGKAYDDDASMKIDNISMHCFVTDPCADQFFDYLFDFWRLDLKRNSDNIFGEKGKEYFNMLLDEIRQNNFKPVNNIMKHTSMAVEMSKQSCSMRLRRLIQMMDDCFRR